MYPFLSIGPFAIPTKALIYMVGVWLALSVVERAAARLNNPDLKPSEAYNTAITGLIAGLVGARFAFVFLFWSAFASDPFSIIWPLNSGYSVGGGVLIGGSALFFYARAKHLPYAGLLDALAPALLVVFAAVSLADWLGGPGYGVNSALFSGRHPVQLYELIGIGLGLVGWWGWHRQRPFKGVLALICTALYAATLVLVAPFRANPWLVAGFYAVQLIAAVVMVTSLLALTYLTPKKHELI